MLAALAGHSLGGLAGFGNLAGLLGGRTSSALFIDLLHSRTIRDHIIDRFNLQHVYKKRYRIDTVKYLGHQTTVVDDKKSGVITITFSDTDPRRAQAITQAYLDELNSIVTRANTSSARREREFIEKRLVSVQAELQSAEKALSQFSSTNVTLDIKEQTHAMVDAAAKLQAELIVGQSELDSLEQIYGDANVRVRAARARIGVLQSQLTKMSGSAAAEGSDESNEASSQLYPSLRQLPRLAVPYADLYRRVRIQETVFELLSQQYEMARLEEAKDTPVVAVIDQPLVAEKKSFPPRLLMMLLLTGFSVGATAFYIVLRSMWERMGKGDPRKVLAEEIGDSVRRQMERRLQRRLGVE
jgi:capsule polysaccharide export protein KpsE/RkpR